MSHNVSSTDNVLQETTEQDAMAVSTNEASVTVSDSLSHGSATNEVATRSQDEADATGPFTPWEPLTREEAGLSERQVETLVLKFLFNHGTAMGREIAEQIALPFRFLEDVLHRLKEELIVVYKAGGPFGDYTYELSDHGMVRAQRFSDECTYFGAAPVSWEDYLTSVAAQSVRNQKPRLTEVREALSDLVLDDEILYRIGEAMNAGLGFFLSGAPGNGKTSIAERVTQAYGESVWIPRAIAVGGDVIRLYDSRCHEALPMLGGDDPDSEPKIDRRWILIRRPTIVVGGELTMESLEITKDPVTRISEAPLQLKSNCGTLVIDDFGRQRISPSEMLNRWIVPLEKRYDFLNVSGGRKLKAPFDQLVIFSSNLDPSRLVDEAFLRRIPYKIEVQDPTEKQFRDLFRKNSSEMKVVCREEAIDYLLNTHYVPTNRCRRFCHPQALLQQIQNYCTFRDLPAVVTTQSVDAAVKNYFSIT